MVDTGRDGGPFAPGRKPNAIDGDNRFSTGLPGPDLSGPDLSVTGSPVTGEYAPYEYA